MCCMDNILKQILYLPESVLLWKSSWIMTLSISGNYSFKSVDSISMWMFSFRTWTIAYGTCGLTSFSWSASSAFVLINYRIQSLLLQNLQWFTIETTEITILNLKLGRFGINQLWAPKAFLVEKWATWFEVELSHFFNWSCLVEK